MPLSTSVRMGIKTGWSVREKPRRQPQNCLFQKDKELASEAGNHRGFKIRPTLHFLCSSLARFLCISCLWMTLRFCYLFVKHLSREQNQTPAASDFGSFVFSQTSSFMSLSVL